MKMTSSKIIEEPTLLNNRYSYKKHDSIGEGSFGKVYRGTDLKTNLPVAIKFLDKEDFKKPQNKAYLDKEILILKICDCPYSTRLIDNFEDDKFYYIILELCDGDLSQELKKQNGCFPLNTIRKILIQLNHVFQIMYKNKIIHRDLKLQNIFVKYTNSAKTEFDVKLGDYGISTIAENNLAKTFTGTPITIAPEILRGEQYTNKVDLWSMGVLTYKMSYGDYPFEANNLIGLLIMMKISKPMHVSKDPQFEDLVKRLLKYEVDERISWEEYFNHPFFGQPKLSVKQISKEDNKKLIEALNLLFAKFISENQSGIIKKKFDLESQGKAHLFKTNDYSCCFAKDKKTGKSYIVKIYGSKFADKYRKEIDKEKQMFQKINTSKSKIPALVFVGEEVVKNGIIALIFEKTKGIVLSDYIQYKQLTSNSAYDLCLSVVNDILIPMNKLGIYPSLFCLDSIIMSFEDNTPILFDCGLFKYVYTTEQTNEYFIYQEERNIPPNEKTNVLNFAASIYKAIFRKSIPNGKVIIPQTNNILDSSFNKLLESALDVSSKRPNFSEIREILTSQLRAEISQFNKIKESLLSTEMLQHFFISNTKKVQIAKYFIESSLFSQLSPKFMPCLCLFFLTILGDIHNAFELFNNIIENKNPITATIDIVYLDNQNDLGKPLIETLDFEVIPKEKLYFKENDLNYMKNHIKDLNNLKDRIGQILKTGKSKLPSSCKNMNLRASEVLFESLTQFNSGSLLSFIHEIGNLSREDKNTKENLLLLNYLLQFAILVYDLNFSKSKIVTKNFHEINNIFIKTMNNTNLVDSAIKSTVFTSFLRNYLKDTQSQKIQNEFSNRKEILYTFRESFIKYYMHFSKKLQNFEFHS